MYKIFLSFSLFILSPFLWAQIVVRGTVVDNSGLLIDQGYVVSSSSKDGSFLEYAAISNGAFSLNLVKVYGDTIFIKTKVTSFKDTNLSIPLSSIVNASLTLNFTLQPNEELLEEIIIKRELAERVIVKKDTISYSAKQIADVGDRKLIDLIDNVPYLKYDEQKGTITYKGVAIQTITINGKNIVDSNYGVIAKNLNIDMIDRLETIDNYSDNPITKTFETDDKKSVNIVLNKNALQLTTSVEGVIASFDSLNPAGGVSLTNSVFNEIVNAFNDVSTNNVGVNPTSLSPQEVSDKFDKGYYGSSLRGLFDSFLGIQDPYGISQATVNENINGSLNSVLSLSKKTGLKINADYFRDAFEITKSNEITYLNTNDALNTSLSSNAILKPTFIDLRLDLESKLSQKELLKLKTAINLNSKDIKNSAIRNNLDSFELLNDNSYKALNLGTEYSRSLSIKTALKIESHIEYEENNSMFSSSPGFVNQTGGELSGSSQNYLLSQLRYNANATHYYKNASYSITSAASYFRKNIEMNSNAIFDISNGVSTNTLNLNSSNVLLSSSFIIEQGKFKFTVAPRVIYLNQYLNANQNILTKDIVDFLPSVGVHLNLKKGLVFLNAKRDIRQLNLENAFLSPLLIDEFTLTQNSPSLDLITNNSLTLGFLMSGEDITTSNFQLFATFFQSDAAFLPNLMIDQDIIFVENNLQEFKSETLQISTGYSHFINKLNLNYNLAPTFQYSIAPGSINDSAITGVESYNYGTKLEINTAFSGFFNISTSTELVTNNSKFEQSNFSNTRFTQFVKLKLRPTKKVSAILTYNYFIPDISQSYSIGFMDATVNLNYFKKAKLSVIGRNLTNNLNIQSVQIDPFSRSFSAQNVLPRYYGFRIEFDL